MFNVIRCKHFVIGMEYSNVSTVNCHDIIAYKQIELFKFLDFVVPTSNESCWMKLIVQLAPYSKHQLEKAKRTNIAKYVAMLCFNTILSLQRITIERAFGMLVNRFLILMAAISFKLATVSQVILACAKLHNLCLMSFGASIL